MLLPILGSYSAERILLYLLIRKEGYSSEIAKYYAVPTTAIKQQLEKFEDAGVIAGKNMGRTRVYQFNPAYPFLSPLRDLLHAAFAAYPKEDQEQLRLNRRRPRKKGKPLT